jgi:hypothetical protein
MVPIKPAAVTLVEGRFIVIREVILKEDNPVRKITL